MTESQDYNYRRDPSLSLSAKLKLTVEKRKQAGIDGRGRVGAFASNKLGPAYFLSVAFGAVGWGLGVAVPHRHKEDTMSLVLSEVFIIYVFVNVMVNYHLIRATDTSYAPDLEEVLHDASVQQTETPDANGDGPENTGHKQASLDTSGAEVSVTSHRVRVATGYKDGELEKREVPYWSWAPCLTCSRPRPPRCHHCNLCKMCVLRRDHHCFISRVCIGAYNQRYFMYYLFWSVWITNLGNVYVLPYMFSRVLSRCGYWNLLPPVTLANVFYGHVTLLELHLVLVCWGIVVLTVLSAGMLAFYIYLMVNGMTKFEYDRGIRVEEFRTVGDRVRSVMGANWGYGLLVPGYSVSGPLEDPVHWPSIKLD